MPPLHLVVWCPMHSSHSSDGSDLFEMPMLTGNAQVHAPGGVLKLMSDLKIGDKVRMSVSGMHELLGPLMATLAAASLLWIYYFLDCR